MSFFMCYYDAYVKGYNSIAVFEDDIVFNVDLEKMNTAIDDFFSIDLNVQVLFMGYCHILCKPANKRGKALTNTLFELHHQARAVCNHALIWKQKAIEKYMERENVVYWTHTNDNTLDLWMRQERIKKVVTKFEYVSQDREHMGSFNENNWKNKWEEKNFKRGCRFDGE